MEEIKQTDNIATETVEEKPVKRTVLDYDDVVKMAPFFKGKPKLVNRIFKLISMDKVNWIHSLHFDTPGVPFCTGLLGTLGCDIKVDNEEVLDAFPNQAFITVSNHIFGALDGIMLIDLVGRHRPKFKVMVNMILKHITAMNPNMIFVDALASNDPEKQRQSKIGITETIRQVKSGEPMGFFPAGAVSKVTKKLRIEDRDWQPVVTRLIQKMKVPVVPIFFHGRNSNWFNFLGMISWKLRTLRLPAEVFSRKSYKFRISCGEPIMPEELAKFTTPEELGAFLKSKTYALRDQYGKKSENKS
ncbi:MAG: lysophospholipid acyltransferase family protein [Muribaculaceae bacterium]|nr:lysophospholipid acyltransferase family protein [Muribaculaceae bacterium]